MEAQQPPPSVPNLSEADTAWEELIRTVAGMAGSFRWGERAVADEQSALEGFPWMLSLLHVGALTQIWADPAHPAFVDIVGPEMKWGGDNADATYCHTAVDPDLTYRVWGNRGDAVYFSLTVYGGPRDGRYSERIVGSINDEGLEFGEDGSFEFLLAAEGGVPDAYAHLPVIQLEADATTAITRDYHANPGVDRRVDWHIECLDEVPPRQWTDASMAAALRAMRTWLDEQMSFQPLVLGERNVVDEPYPVPTETFGWAAGDASYAMGRFALGDDEALVIRGRSPECRFWNLCLWNPYLHTYDYRAGRVTLNGHQVQYEDDGSWEIVVAHRDPSHPNWVQTQGHTEGLLWFRWFLPVETPERPATEVITLD
jgi:hypothetical protein